MARSTSRSTAEIAADLKLLELDKQATADKLKGLGSIFNIQQRISAQQQEMVNSKREENLLSEQYLSNAKKGSDLQSAEMLDLKERIARKKSENQLDEKKISNQKKNNDLIKHYANEYKRIFSLQAGWIKGLMDSDKIIRTTILNLGMSGKKADQMRMSFEKSAVAVAQMGGSLKDIQAVQEGYANETGRARVLTASMLKDIISIGRGTGLGVEEATKLGAQFELMGFDARTTAEAIQGIVDTSERMGVNTTKVLKGVNDNFKRLQTYSFQGGVKGMLKMSQYAAKMNVDMNQALNAADVAKSLEGAIDLAAQLQVMGGEFAKTDPFEMLFLSRNDPAKFTEKINQMTKGVVSFRKMADGTFEKFISPADRQRLASVEKSLGMQTGELTQQALRMSDIQKMRQNMLNTTLTKSDKEIIEGAAIYNKKTGMFQVTVGNNVKNIGDLTEKEAKLFVQQQATLEQRAKDSLTFQEALEATLDSLRKFFLPILRGFNDVMKIIVPPIQKLITGFGLLNTGFARVIGGVTAAAILLGIAATTISKAVYTATGKNMFGWNAGARMSGVGGQMGGGAMYPPNIAKNVGAQRAFNQGIANRGVAAESAGRGSMMKGAGVGMAAVGIGAGIGLAAVGIGQLAKAIKDVDVDKLKVMNVTIGILGATMIGLGIAGTFAGPGILAFGAAAIGIGAGIGIASAGIGYMAEGLSKLVLSSKDADMSLAKVAVGIAGINIAMASTGTVGFLGGLLGGFSTLSKTIDVVSSKSEAIAKVGAAFKEINLAMSGSKEDFVAVQNAVNAISSMNASSGSAMAQLAQLLKTPLKVEFTDKKVQFVSDITLEIDGQKFMQKVYTADVAAHKALEAKLKGIKS